MKKYFVMAMVALGLAACTTADDVPQPAPVEEEAVAVNLAQAPDFKVYSNGHVLGTSMVQTRTYGNGSFVYQKPNSDGTYPGYSEFDSKTPSEPTAAEKEYVLNYIKEHSDEGLDSCPFTEYFIQNIGSSYDTYTTTAKINGDRQTNDVTGGNQMDQLYINGKHMNDFNITSGWTALVLNNPVTNCYYHDSWGENGFRYDVWKLYNIPGYGWYLGFDYKTEKNSTGQRFDGDGIYNDWVVKLVPAIDNTPVDNPDASKSQVEINLSVNDEKEKDDQVATKLSIHVRAVTDVEVFIPIKEELYCDVDDMYIIEKKDVKYTYGDSNSFTMNINGDDVKFETAFEANGIRVKVTGITQNVIDYCNQTYGDGVTFEVWNYYNETTVRDDIKAVCDKATVTFSKNPDTYINAFHKKKTYAGYVYDKEIDGKLYPYVLEPQYDEEGKITSFKETDTAVAADYWTRCDAPYEKYYAMNTEKNLLDCTVSPDSNSFNDGVACDGTDNRDYDVYYDKK